MPRRGVFALALVAACGSRTGLRGEGARADAAAEVAAPADVADAPADVAGDVASVDAPEPVNGGATSCAGADLVPPGRDAMYVAAFGGPGVTAWRCFGGAVPDARVRFFRTTVAPGESLEVTAHEVGDVFASVRIYQDCAGSRCLAENQFVGGDPRSATTHWTNEGAAPREVFFAAGYDGAAPGARPSVRVHVRSLRAAPNARCEGAVALALDRPLDGQNTLSGGAPPPRCPVRSEAAGMTLWYAVDAFGGRVLSVAAQADPTIRPVPMQVRLYPGCNAECLGDMAASLGNRDVVATWRSPDGAPTRVYAAVSAGTGNEPVHFRVTASARGAR